MIPKTVVISQEQYAELLYDQNFLYLLEEAGVDNWSGYDMVRREMRKYYSD
jgi:hypothetical protein